MARRSAPLLTALALVAAGVPLVMLAADPLRHIAPAWFGDVQLGAWPPGTPAFRHTLVLGTAVASSALAIGGALSIGLWLAGRALRMLGLAMAAGWLVAPFQLALDRADGPVAAVLALPSAALVYHCAQAAALVVLILVPALRTLDPAILDAAASCGAGPVTALFRVVLPPVAVPLGVAWAAAFALAVIDGPAVCAWLVA